MPPKLKCLWQWICDKCDPAGVIDVDYEAASFQIGSKVTEEDLKSFGDRVELLPCGKWWIVRFIPFQYGVVSEACRAHGPVLSAISAYSLEDRVSKGYSKVLNTLHVQDKVQDKDNTGGVGGEKSKPRKDRGTLDEVRDFCAAEGIPDSDAQAMFHKWEGCGWKNGGAAIKDWRSVLRSWRAGGWLPSQKNPQGATRTTAQPRPDRFDDPMEKMVQEALKNAENGKHP